MTMIHCMPVAADQEKILLFYYQDCSYCTKVYLFLEQYKLLDKVTLVDTTIDENRKLLQTISGKTQVPYICDTVADIKMAESDDIIQYFIEKYQLKENKPNNGPIAIATLASDNHNLAMQYNQETFITDIKNLEKPTLILISTTWCPPCKLFKPIFLQVAQEYGQQCNFICLDADAHRSIAQQLNIQSIPTIICYKNKQEIRPQNYRSQKDLVQLIEQLLRP